MLNLIKDMIEKYHSNDDSLKPWNEVEQYFLDRPEIYEVGIARFIHVANQNVAHRFNNLKKAKGSPIWHWLILLRPKVVAKRIIWGHFV